MVKYNQMSSSISITIFHQNICGLKGKTDELVSSMSADFPHILCFSEHHLEYGGQYIVRNNLLSSKS